MSRRRVKTFDPVASLNGLIDEFERVHSPHTGAESQHILDRVDSAVANFKRGVLALHRAEGDSSGVEVLLSELERVSRRAVRTADEYGAPCAPHTAADSTNVSAVRATTHSIDVCPLTTSQGEVSAAETSMLP